MAKFFQKLIEKTGLSPDKAIEMVKEKLPPEIAESAAGLLDGTGGGASEILDKVTGAAEGAGGADGATGGLLDQVKEKGSEFLPGSKGG